MCPDWRIHIRCPVTPDWSATGFPTYYVCDLGVSVAITGLLRQRQEWNSEVLSLPLKSWVRSERFLILPLLILVREKISLSFDVVIESNLPCPFPDIAYGEDCRSQNTNTNKHVDKQAK